MDASVAPSSAAPSSSAPRVSFVEVRPKWPANQPPPPARAPAALSDAAGAHRRDVPLTRDVEAWMERVRLRPAPPGHFVEVSALHALFVADLDAAARARSPPASSSAPASPPEVSLQTFSSVLGKTMRRAERARGSDPAPPPPQPGVFVPARRRKGHLNATCDRLPAKAHVLADRYYESRGDEGRASSTATTTGELREDDKDENADARSRSRSSRKSRRASLDPARSRASAPNAGPTFTRYVNECLRLACAPELMRLRLFPDAKELTESFAINAAVRTHLASTHPASDERVTLVAVGDGNTPRTAALFAFLTRWHCVAIDPILVPWATWREKRRIEEDDEHSVRGTPRGGVDPDEGGADDPNPNPNDWGGVRRLRAFARTMQETVVECDRAVLVMVHAHVSLADCLRNVRTRSGRLAAVIMPCCDWYGKLAHPTRGRAPSAEYEDRAVVSPQRLVRVFDDLPCGVTSGGGSDDGAKSDDGATSAQLGSDDGASQPGSDDGAAQLCRPVAET